MTPPSPRSPQCIEFGLNGTGGVKLVWVLGHHYSLLLSQTQSFSEPLILWFSVLEIDMDVICVCMIRCACADQLWWSEGICRHTGMRKVCRQNARGKTTIINNGRKVNILKLKEI
jgi:hypothetical protein